MFESRHSLTKRIQEIKRKHKLVNASQATVVADILNPLDLAKQMKAMPRRTKMSLPLNQISEDEFNMWKALGLLHEFYPNAPNFYNQIKRAKSK